MRCYREDGELLFLLLLILAIICISTYLVRRTLLSPTLIAGSVGFFCVMVAIIGNVLFWNIPFNPMIVLIISVGMCSMFAGEIIGASMNVIHTKIRRKQSLLGRMILPRRTNILLLLFGIAVDVRFFLFNRSLGLSALEINQVANTVNVAYPTSLLFFARTVLAIGFVYIFILTNNIVFRIKTHEKDKGTIQVIPGIIVAFICQILFTSRSGILAYLMFFAVGLIVSLYRLQEHKSKKKNFKILLRKIVIAVAVFFVFFMTMGVVMKKFTGGVRLIQLLIIYIAGGVLGFSLWFDTFPIQNTTGISETFEGIYAFLSRFGANYNIKSVPDLWARWMNGSFSTNVFMAFKSYYYDWGLSGVIIINFCVGLIYTRLLYRAIDKKSSYVTILICTYLSSGIIYTFIGRIFSGMFTLAWWSYAFQILVLSYLIFRKCIIVPQASICNFTKKDALL